MDLEEIEKNHYKNWQYKAPEYIEWLISRCRELEAAYNLRITESDYFRNETIRLRKAIEKHRAEPMIGDSVGRDRRLYAVLDKKSDTSE